MPTLDAAQAFAKLRGLDFSVGNSGNAALANAADYIAGTYKLRAIKTDDDQTRYDNAVYLLAIDIQANGVPAVRAAQNAKEVKKQLGTLLTDTTYFDAPTDLYPIITGTLQPLIVNKSAVRFGRLVRS